MEEPCGSRRGRPFTAARVAPGLQRGGAERVLIDLIRYPPDMRHVAGSLGGRNDFDNGVKAAEASAHAMDALLVNAPVAAQQQQAQRLRVIGQIPMSYMNILQKNVSALMLSMHHLKSGKLYGTFAKSRCRKVVNPNMRRRERKAEKFCVSRNGSLIFPKDRHGLPPGSPPVPQIGSAPVRYGSDGGSAGASSLGPGRAAAAVIQAGPWGRSRIERSVRVETSP